MTCPECSTTVSSDATVCPRCGHDLTEVVVGVDRPAETSSRPPWLVFGGVAAAVLGLGAVAFGFLAGEPVGAATYTDRMPADAVVYIEVDVEQLTSDTAEGLIEAFDPVVEQATGEGIDLEAMLDEVLEGLDAELAELDLTFSDDIAPWAGGPVAAAMLDAGPDRERGAVVVGGDDPDALDAFLETVAANGGDAVTGTVDIAGTEFLTLDADGEQAVMGRSGTDLVVTTDVELATAIVTGEGETLDDVEGFTTQLERLPDADGAAFLFAVDADAATAGLESLDPAMGGLGGLSGFGSLNTVGTGWAVGSVSLETEVVRVDSVATLGEDAPVPTSDENLTAALPAETVAFARFGPAVAQLETVFGGIMGDTDEEIAPGVSLADVFGIFSVDGAVGVWPSSEPELPVNAALIGVSDSNQSELVDRIADAAAMMGVPTTPSDTGYVIEGLVGLGTRDTYTILSTDQDLIAQAPADSLADGPLLARAGELVDGETQMAVDVAAVVDLVDGLVATEDPEAAEALACLPFGVAASASSLEDGIMSTSFAMEISRPDGC